MAADNEIELEPIWTVIANVVQDRACGPGGLEKRPGTKHFSPGTKVYIIDWYAGMYEYIIVVGLSRKPKRFIKVVLRADWVDNLRVKLCYDPAAQKKIYEHFDGDDINRLNKDFVEQMCKAIPHWQSDIKKGKS